MADLDRNTQASLPVSITGEDELFKAAVTQGTDGVNRLKVDSQTAPAILSELFNLNFLNGGSPDLTVNGSGTPIQFDIPLSNNDRVINSISIYGRDNGISFGKFLALNSALANGITFEIKSNDNTFTSLPITITDDFRNRFCISPRDFVVDFASSEDAFTASFVSPSPIIIRNQNEFTTPDYVRVTINDNLTAINYLEAIVFGSAL